MRREKRHRIEMRQIVRIFYNRIRSSLRLFFPGLIALLLLFCGLLKKKIALPSAIVYSISKEQFYRDEGFNGVLNSLKEERFQVHYNSKNLLVEVRSLISIFVGGNSVTIDAALFMLLNCLRRKHYPVYFRNVIRLSLDYRNQKNMSLRGIKTLVIDLALYKTFEKEVCPEIDLITTNSSLSKLPRIFGSALKGTRIMLWYSTNGKPIKFRGRQQDLKWSPISIKTIVNLHLVWTHYDVKFLESLGIRNACAVGPILLQAQNIEKKETSKYIITYFDVTPVSREYVFIQGGDENFYSEQNALSDLESIGTLSVHLSNMFGDKVKICIKPKRSYSRRHAKEYIAKLLELSHNFNIELLDYRVNLYKIISQSDLVIATPWSSPAILGKVMSVNSVYFAIRDTDWELPSEYEGIRVFKSEEKLIEFIVKEIKSKKQQRIY